MIIVSVSELVSTAKKLEKLGVKTVRMVEAFDSKTLEFRASDEVTIVLSQIGSEDLPEKPAQIWSFQPLEKSSGT